MRLISPPPPVPIAAPGKSPGIMDQCALVTIGTGERRSFSSFFPLTQSPSLTRSIYSTPGNSGTSQPCGGRGVVNQSETGQSRFTGPAFLTSQVHWEAGKTTFKLTHTCLDRYVLLVSHIAHSQVTLTSWHLTPTWTPHPSTPPRCNTLKMKPRYFKEIASLITTYPRA